MSDPKAPEAEATVTATETAAEDPPIEQSLEEAALERARAHIAELEAQAKVHDELAGAPPEVAPAAAVKPTREEADAQALEEFERLRQRSPKKTL